MYTWISTCLDRTHQSMPFQIGHTKFDLLWLDKPHPNQDNKQNYLLVCSYKPFHHMICYTVGLLLFLFTSFCIWENYVLLDMLKSYELPFKICQCNIWRWHANLSLPTHSPQTNCLTSLNLMISVFCILSSSLNGKTCVHWSIVSHEQYGIVFEQQRSEKTHDW